MSTPRAWLACAVLSAAVAAVAPGAARAQEGAAAGEAVGPATQSEESEDDDASAAEEERQRSCRTIARQIAHFEGVAERAAARDNELWKRSTELHIQRLEAYRGRRGCPDATDPGLGQQAARALRKLGRLALTASTFGAF